MSVLDLMYMKLSLVKSCASLKVLNLSVLLLLAGCTYGSTQSTYTPTKRGWGFIDKTGKVVVEPQFDGVDGSGESEIRLVSVDEHCTYIDGNGKLLTPWIYEKGRAFDSVGVLMKDVDPSIGEYRTVVIVDRSGKTQPLKVGFRDFSFGLSPAVPPGANLWGYIDTTGKWVIKPQFADAGCFQAPDLAEADGFMINRKGKKLFKLPEGYSTFGCSEGLLLVETGEGEKHQVGFLNSSGKFVFPPIRGREVSGFSDGLALVSSLPGTGDHEQEFERRSHEIDYFIDKTGKTVIKAKDASEHFRPFSDGLAVTCDYHQSRVIDTSGKTKFITDPKFEIVYDFHDGLAGVGLSRDRNNEKFGYIDGSGKLVVPTKYLHGADFIGGRAAVEFPK
jgi:hypothetical protein